MTQQEQISSTKNEKVSEHYLEEKGEEYYQTVFPGEMFGRAYQALAFAKYCSDKDTVLDFGCYDGLLVRNVPAAKRIGVDLNSAAGAACKKLDEKTGIKVEFCNSLEKITPGSIDVVFSNHCLEHVPHPLEALKLILATLKPGGKLLLKVPFDDWRQKFHRHWVPNDPNYHLYTWCPINLGNLVAEAGFEVDTVTINSLFWHPRFKMIDKIFGPKAFMFVSKCFSRLCNRREIYCVAHKKSDI